MHRTRVKPYLVRTEMVTCDVEQTYCGQCGSSLCSSKSVNFCATSRDALFSGGLFSSRSNFCWRMDCSCEKLAVFGGRCAIAQPVRRTSGNHETVLV